MKRWHTLSVSQRVRLILLRAGFGLAFSAATVAAMVGLFLLSLSLWESYFGARVYLAAAPLPLLGVWLLHRLYGRLDARFGIQHRILDDVPPKALVSRPEPGLAAICVFRSQTVGASVNVPVMLGTRLMGETSGANALFFPVDPGSHELTTRVKMYMMRLPLEARAGTTYFVWHEVKPFSHRSRLHLVGSATGLPV